MPNGRASHDRDDGPSWHLLPHPEESPILRSLPRGLTAGPGTSIDACIMQIMPTGDSSVDSQRLLKLLSQRVRALGVLDRKRLVCCGVTVPQCYTLCPLLQGRTSRRDLSVLMGIAPSTLTRNIASLARNGRVRPFRDREDRRMVWVEITEEGAGMARSLWARGLERQRTILSRLSQEEVGLVLSGLEILVGALLAEATDGGNATALATPAAST